MATDRHPRVVPGTREIVSTGIAGLDDILAGGLTRGRLYLVEGTPGAGKTTLALQFLLDGARRGEKGLYITLSESADELACGGGLAWLVPRRLEVYELVSELGLDPDSEQSILHPSEVELGETVREVIERVDDAAARPRRVRQPLRNAPAGPEPAALSPPDPGAEAVLRRSATARSSCSTTAPPTERPAAPQHRPRRDLCWSRSPRDFGAERRRLRVLKMRGVKFRGGYHDFILDTGGLEVFPRLVAAEHHRGLRPRSQFDRVAGTRPAARRRPGRPAPTRCCIGPSGVGKTTTARPLHAGGPRSAARRRPTILFDEGQATLLARSAALGMDLRPHIWTAAR